jgi:hypothetical protein
MGGERTSPREKISIQYGVAGLAMYERVRQSCAGLSFHPTIKKKPSKQQRFKYINTNFEL